MIDSSSRGTAQHQAMGEVVDGNSLRNGVFWSFDTDTNTPMRAKIAKIHLSNAHLSHATTAAPGCGLSTRAAETGTRRQTARAQRRQDTRAAEGSVMRTTVSQTKPNKKQTSVSSQSRSTKLRQACKQDTCPAPSDKTSQAKSTRGPSQVFAHALQCCLLKHAVRSARSAFRCGACSARPSKKEDYRNKNDGFRKGHSPRTAATAPTAARRCRVRELPAIPTGRIAPENM